MLSTSNCLAVRHDLDLHALAQAAVDDAREHDDAAVGIEPGVEDERLQRRVRVSVRRRQTMDHRFQDVGNAQAGLRGDGERVVGGQPDGLLDHLAGAFDVGRGQVDLVDDRDDLEAVVDGEVGVGQGLRFHALRCVHHQQRALAGSQRARHFIAEVDVSGGVDQVELIGLAVVRLVHHAHGVGLDGDAALALQVHGIEHLRLHLARGERAGEFQQSVGERGLAVIDVRDDREVADVIRIHAGCRTASIFDAITVQRSASGPWIRRECVPKRGRNVLQ